MTKSWASTTRSGGRGRTEAPVKLAPIREGAALVAEAKVRVVLALMKGMELVREVRGARYSLRRADLGREELERMAREYEERGASDREKLELMMLYGQTARCRWGHLLAYFGETENREECGTCDNCLHPPRAESKTARPPDTPREKDEEKKQRKLKEGDKVEVRLPGGEVKKFKKEFLR